VAGKGVKLVGTSSSYGGLTGGNKLLPPWAQDSTPSSPEEGNGGMGSGENVDGDNQKAQNENSLEGNSAQLVDLNQQPIWVRVGSWRDPKIQMRQYVSNRGDLGRVGRSYVKAKGGARAAAKSAVAGKRATARLGGFLSDIVKYGIARAMSNLGLQEIVGKSAEVVLAAIAQVLSPPGSTLEEHIARRAVNETMTAVFEKYGANQDDIYKLDAMDEAGVREVIIDCVQNYIYQRWLQELGDRIEKHAMTAQQAVRLERDVKAYVKEAVKLDLGNVDVLSVDWNSPQIRNTIESIYTDAYGMLEV